MARSIINRFFRLPWLALANFVNVRGMSDVMRAGKWFDRERLDSMLANVEARVNPTGAD